MVDEYAIFSSVTLQVISGMDDICNDVTINYKMALLVLWG